MAGTTAGGLARRRFLRCGLGLSAAVGAVTLLPGCRELIEGVAESCPDDPDESGGVDWNPDALRPVFWGYQEFGTDDGAPRDLRVYYPTYEGFTDGPPILKLCITRWPVVLFLHGEPPREVAVEEYYRRWTVIGRTLARSGYVVVVPSYDLGLGSAERVVPEALEVVDWVRNDWPDAEWVDQRAESTGVAGHSYGALRATLVAAAQPEFGALLTLGAPFGQPGGDEAREALASVSMASFIAWASNEGYEDLGAMWEELAEPRYLVGYDGEHFDYLPDRSDIQEVRGPCSQIGPVIAELAALFLSRQVPVLTPSREIPVDLRPPEIALTDSQRFFHGGHLHGLSQIEDDPDCRVDLRWQVADEAGSRRLGA